MSDANSETVMNIDQFQPKTIRESKLYQLARSRQLLNDLIPDINVLAPTELWIDEEHPRQEEHSDNTRIFIMYTNDKKNTSIKMFQDHTRLMNEFDIDTFMNNFKIALTSDGTQIPTEDPIEVIEVLIKNAVNFASGVILGLDDPLSMHTSVVSLSALVSILYDDPLDVFISILDLPLHPGEDPVPTLVAMWKLKNRK